MATDVTNTLNSLLRGELAATETYQQAITKLRDEPGADELSIIYSEHREAANALRALVRDSGERPAKSSGVWGTFAKAVEGTATILCNDAALKALKEGEEYGIKQYQSALHDVELYGPARNLIKSTLLPHAYQHVPALNRLMAGLVERINPVTAHQHLEFNDDALLVCAYDDTEKFRKNRLEDALSLEQFKVLEQNLPKDTEIIFYCA